MQYVFLDPWWRCLCISRSVMKMFCLEFHLWKLGSEPPELLWCTSAMEPFRSTSSRADFYFFILKGNECSWSGSATFWLPGPRVKVSTKNCSQNQIWTDKKREIIKNLHYKSSSRFSINEQKKLSKILIK